MRVLLGLVLALAACDSRATASDQQARAELKSKEYETCAASVQCRDELRCVDHVCRRTARSVVGDYQAAFGAAARARGELEAAVAAYAAAVGHYGAEKIAVPPDLECAYGATLAAARSLKDYGERAAHVLHRCVLAVPAGSALQHQALASLATLGELGLDPLLLGATKPADVYLTKGPAKPRTDKLQITVAAAPQPSTRHWAKVPAALTSPALRPALIACWTQHNEATKKTELAVTVGLKIAYATNPAYEDEGRWVTRLDDPAATAGPADACVRAAIEPVLKDLRLNDRIDTRLTILVK